VGNPLAIKKYGEWVAILVGDLLQTLSFEFLAEADLPGFGTRYFARAVGSQGMVAGQFLDMESNTSSTLRLHRMKTGKLIEAAVALPFMAAENKIRRPVMRWGRGLGLLFQVTDDLLDATGNSATLGKTAGKDAAQNKKTIVAHLGLDRAKEYSHALATKLTSDTAKIFSASRLFSTLPKYLLERQS
jgi:geranylgeranyl pyrophosphate synthase